MEGKDGRGARRQKMWRKQFEGEQVEKASTVVSHRLEDSGMMRQMEQPKLQRFFKSNDVELFLTTCEYKAQAYKWPPDIGGFDFDTIAHRERPSSLC